VFVDDSPANVEGARAVGMHAVHFTGPEPLATDLRRLGFAL
jgi:2-haloacid dehalogenase